jgi:hypothetical protein
VGGMAARRRIGVSGGGGGLNSSFLPSPIIDTSPSQDDVISSDDNANEMRMKTRFRSQDDTTLADLSAYSNRAAKDIYNGGGGGGGTVGGRGGENDNDNESIASSNISRSVNNNSNIFNNNSNYNYNLDTSSVNDASFVGDESVASVNMTNQNESISNNNNNNNNINEYNI